LSSSEISKLMIGNQNSTSRAIKSVIMALQMDSDRRGVAMIELRLGNNATPNTYIFFKKKISFFNICFIILLFLIEKLQVTGVL
jgi:hypothetical protein